MYSLKSVVNMRVSARSSSFLCEQKTPPDDSSWMKQAAVERTTYLSYLYDVESSLVFRIFVNQSIAWLCIS
jgi:hypothetical protein